MKEEFDYKKALEELEAIAKKVEDPATALGDIDKMIARSDALIASCREYLRTVRENLESMQQ
ncbi:MAG: exodeoxyribonuclease VII small subunit [Bacteroidales bacterium]|nr:exodeoxyribonuclease VII small subunit [Bacteroidales bacterium]